MPRTRPLTESQRKRDAFAGVLAKYQAIYNVEHRDVAVALGMSRDTYRLRRNDPDKFTLGEIKILARRLHIPGDEIKDILL